MGTFGRLMGMFHAHASFVPPPTSGAATKPCCCSPDAVSRFFLGGMPLATLVPSSASTQISTAGQQQALHEVGPSTNSLAVYTHSEGHREHESSTEGHPRWAGQVCNINQKEKLKCHFAIGSDRNVRQEPAPALWPIPTPIRGGRGNRSSWNSKQHSVSRPRPPRRARAVPCARTPRTQRRGTCSRGGPRGPGKVGVRFS